MIDGIGGVPLDQRLGMPGKMCTFPVDSMIAVVAWAHRLLLAGSAPGKYGHSSYPGTVRLLSGLSTGNIAIQASLCIRCV